MNSAGANHKSRRSTAIMKRADGRYRRGFVICLLAVLAASSYFTYRAVSQPLWAEVETQENLVKQKTNYDYQVKVMPSALYPKGGTVQPDRVIFTELTDAVYIKAVSSLAADKPFKIAGKRKALLSITADGYWQRDFPLFDEEEFSAEGEDLIACSYDIAVKPELYIDFINRVEEETRFSASGYLFAIKPVVEGVIIHDNIEAPIQPFPELVFKYSSNKLELESVNTVSEAAIPIITRQSVMQDFSLLGHQVPLSAARYVFSALTGLVLLLGIYILRDVQKQRKHLMTETVLIDKKYAGRLVFVKDSVDMKGRDIVNVDTMKSLVRIADEKECPIFRYGDKRIGVTHYYVTDGSFIYRFSASDKPGVSVDGGIGKPIPGSVASHDI